MTTTSSTSQSPIFPTITSGRQRRTVPYCDDVRPFREGDTVRSYDNDDPCVVLGRWGDWLWLDPTDYRNAAPFTARARDYYVVNSAQPPANR
jgi:hypothetical protein